MARGLRDAQDRAVWKLGCKNRPIPARWKNKPSSRKRSLSSTLLEQTDDDDDGLQFDETNTKNLATYQNTVFTNNT